MSENPITPSQVTKPIQLLAAWLVGLLTLNSSYLIAAAKIDHPSWAAGALVGASILNVPIFLACLFMLQTRFRPEMQEDHFYSQYLEKRYSANTGIEEIVRVEALVEDKSSVPVVSVPSGKLLGVNDDGPLQINCLLSNFEEIRQAIVENGIKIERIFGSEGQNIPSEYLLSAGPRVKISFLRKVLSALDEFPPDYIGSSKMGSYSRSVGTRKDASSIYVGSYMFENASYLKIKYTDKVKAQIFSPKMNDEGLAVLLGF